MTDRYKGFLVTIDKEIRDEDAKEILTALRMIKNVESVKPYVKNAEDYMSEEKGRRDVFMEMLRIIREKIKI